MQSKVHVPRTNIPASQFTFHVTGHTLRDINQRTIVETAICCGFITWSFPDRERLFLCDQLMSSPPIFSENRPLRGLSRTNLSKPNPTGASSYNSRCNYLRYSQQKYALKTSQVVVTARDFFKVEESDCFVNEAWYSTPQ